MPAEWRETLDHLLTCPALRKEQVHLKERNYAEDQGFELSFVETKPILKHELAWKKFMAVATPMCHRAGLSQVQVERIIVEYCISNQNKPFLATRQFLKALYALLKAHNLKTTMPSDSLVKVLIEDCSLSIHLFTDGLITLASCATGSISCESAAFGGKS